MISITTVIKVNNALIQIHKVKYYLGRMPDNNQEYAKFSVWKVGISIMLHSTGIIYYILVQSNCINKIYVTENSLPYSHQPVTNRCS
jgi:hypothetical protein